MKKYTTIVLAALLAAPAFAMSSDDLRRTYVQLDTALNSEYQRVMKQRTPAEQKVLRAEQRAWVAKRDWQSAMQSADRRTSR